MYIAVLCPPNNADSAFLRIKRDLFYENSILSAWTLRPMVPFAVFTEPPEKPERSIIPALPSQGLSFGESVRRGDQLYLESNDCFEFCTEILHLPEFAGLPRIDGKICGGFNAGRGIHLMDMRETGSDDAEEVFMKKIEALDDSAKLWRICSLCLFKADFSDVLWWEKVILEQLWEISLH